MSRFIVGIDPGLNGALAVIDLENKTLGVTRTPTFSVLMKGKKTAAGNPKERTEFDLPAMTALFPLSGMVRGVGIEQVAARTGQGVTSMFRFGYGLGLWHGMLAARDLTFLSPIPMTWKKHFRLIGEEKDASRAKATEVFGDACAPYWAKKKDDGLAEAALIAGWTAVQLGFNLEHLVPRDTFEVKRTRKKKAA